MKYQQLYEQLIESVLQGTGDSTREQRRAAFDNDGLSQPLDSLIEKVAHEAYKVNDSDIDSAKAAGNSEEQLFELIICGAVGQASRQYKSGLAALAEAINKGGGHAS